MFYNNQLVLGKLRQKGQLLTISQGILLMLISLHSSIDLYTRYSVPRIKLWTKGVSVKWESRHPLIVARHPTQFHTRVTTGSSVKKHAGPQECTPSTFGWVVSMVPGFAFGVPTCSIVMIRHRQLASVGMPTHSNFRIVGRRCRGRKLS